MRRTILLGLVTSLLLATVPLVLSALQGLARGTGAAASSLACSVKTSCGAGEVAVFRMSGLANAHAQTTAFSSYPYVVCCGGPVGLSNACSGSYDTVLTLSATDNAHAASSGYGTQVCLSASTGMDCQYGSSCGAGYACLATISGTTNAHVADCDGSGDYGTKVCCSATATATDSDGDGCTDEEEAPALPNDLMPPLLPAETGAFNPLAWYDFYDVPVPVYADPVPNGTRNQAVNVQDVVGVLRYAGTQDNGPPNGYGVDYDSDKNGDTVEDGRDYDRSPSPLPNPPWDAAPPDGVVNVQDVVTVLKQVGLDCSGAP